MSTSQPTDSPITGPAPIGRRAEITWLDAAVAGTPRAASSGPVDLGAPLDLSGRSPAIALRHSDAVAGLPLTIRFGSSAAHHFAWTISSDGPNRPSMFATGEAAEIALSFADVDVVGTPDRAAITWWQLAVDSAPAPEVSVAAIGWMPEPAEFPNGLISLTFDDSYGSQYDIAFSAMSAHGLCGTLVPVIGRFDGPGYLTSGQVRELFDAGWEIGAHALTDETHTAALHSMTAEQRTAELQGIRDWNVANGYPALTYSYPGGYYDVDSAAHTLEYYAGTRSAYGENHETWPPAQLDRIRSVVIKTDTHPDLDAYRAEIAAARDHGAWVVLMFHRLAENADPEVIWEADAQLFRDFCAELAASGVPVLTMAEALLR